MTTEACELLRGGAPARRRGAGFTLQEVLVVLGIMLIVLGLALPSLLASKKVSHGGAALGTLRALHAAEGELHRTTQRYGPLADLAGRGLIDPLLASGAKSGYFHAVRPGRPEHEFAAIAWPQRWGVTGDKLYLIDTNGWIVWTSEKLVDGPDPSAFLDGHPYFRSFAIGDLAGWYWLNGPRVEAGQQTPPSGPAPAPGGGGGGGCALRAPRR